MKNKNASVPPIAYLKGPGRHTSLAARAVQTNNQHLSHNIKTIKVNTEPLIHYIGICSQIHNNMSHTIRELQQMAQYPFIVVTSCETFGHKSH